MKEIFDNEYKIINDSFYPHVCPLTKFKYKVLYITFDEIEGKMVVKTYESEEETTFTSQYFIIKINYVYIS